MRNFTLFALVATTGCFPSEESSAGEESDTETDADSDSDSDTDADEDYLEVAALGFEYVGGWNEETQELENFVYRDANGDPQASGNFVRVTLTSAEYFDMTSGDNGIEEEYCEFLATFYHGVADVPAYEFDWEAGKGSTGNELVVWGSFEGYLLIDTDTYSPRCLELDPDDFEDGDPTSTLDHMHFGLGFGPLSDHLYGIYSDGESFAKYEDAMMTQYIAINHPDPLSGYVFEAFDWTASYLIDTDYESCVDVDDGSGGTFEVCGEYQADEDSYYVPGDATTSFRHGFVTGFSYWLEDTPNLDLSILQNGTEEM